MNLEEYKGKLISPNSGSDTYNRGIKKANRTAKILMGKIFNHFKNKLKSQSEHHKKILNAYHDLLEQECSNCKYYVKSHNECVIPTPGVYMEPLNENFSCSEWKSENE